MERRVFLTTFSNMIFILSSDQLAGLMGDPEDDRLVSKFVI